MSAIFQFARVFSLRGGGKCMLYKTHFLLREGGRGGGGLCKRELNRIAFTREKSLWVGWCRIARQRPRMIRK